MGTAKKRQTQLGFANTAKDFLLSLSFLHTPFLDCLLGLEGGGRAGVERVGVGEDLVQNKQVLQLVAYIAGGPDVSQEAPLRF